MDAEVVGDDVHVQEPKDEQRDSGHADECEHNQDEARESVGRKVSRPTWQPPALCGRRGRFGGHPIRILHREFRPRRSPERLLSRAFSRRPILSRQHRLQGTESPA